MAEKKLAEKMDPIYRVPLCDWTTCREIATKLAERVDLAYGHRAYVAFCEAHFARQPHDRGEAERSSLPYFFLDTYGHPRTPVPISGVGWLSVQDPESWPSGLTLAVRRVAERAREE